LIAEKIVEASVRCKYFDVKLEAELAVQAVGCDTSIKVLCALPLN
jgi:hypothetical protein